jgi:peptidoglycan/xylan/chitin deacetylase (PgdA/CDA1 family)
MTTRRELLAMPVSAFAAATPAIARVAITFDLEMSRNFPRWEDTEWDYSKGLLDEAAKRYSVRAANFVRDNGGRMHFFAVGRVFEQPDIGWLEQIVRDGHPVGNHTYDHVYLLAKTADEIQFRFKRAPWLIASKTVPEVLEENVRMASAAIRKRLGIDPQGFRTPGGFHDGLRGRADLQQMLQRQGFRWISATSRKTNPEFAQAWKSVEAELPNSQPFRYPETGLIDIPMSPVSDIQAFRNGRWNLDDFITILERVIDWTIERGQTFDLLAHPSCIGVVDPEMKTLAMISRKVRDSNGHAVLATLNDIARSVSA